ncbi:MAG: energy-coupling factor transporter transmembrane component T family protein, partial [Acetivibrio ethanolgignens]
MIRDITIGQYYPVDSVIHRLDPRVKLLGTLIYIVSLFLFKSFTGYLVALLFLGTVIQLSRVPLKYILRGLKAVIVLLLFTIGFNIFLTPGEVLWQAWIFKITREGLRS